VERDRAAGAERAVAAGAAVLILDDGFQHRRLARDLDIVLVSAERWSSSPHLLPRGPWREPVAALKRADLVIVTRKAAPAAQADRAAAGVQAVTGRPPLRAHLRPSGWRDREGPSDPPTGPALLVCGLAEPELFRDSAEQAGANVAGFMVFPDHHRYTRGDGERIRRAAKGRTVVTTEKDWTKLQVLLDGITVRLLVQEVVIEAGREELEAALQRATTTSHRRDP
jgi:tetraacyldisaccharide 4'-kinase